MVEASPTPALAKPSRPGFFKRQRLGLLALWGAAQEPRFWGLWAYCLGIAAGVPVVIAAAAVWKLAGLDFSTGPAGGLFERCARWFAELTWQEWGLIALTVSVVSLAFRSAYLEWRFEREAKAAALERNRVGGELAAATTAARDLSPERRVRCEREWKIEDGIDPPTRLGIATHIFNGNTYKVTFELVEAEIHYGERRTKSIEFEGLSDSIGPLDRGWIYVWIKLDGPVGDAIRADLAAGTLQPIDMRRIVIDVCDGRRRGRLDMTDGVRFVHKPSWTVDHPVFDFEQFT